MADTDLAYLTPEARARVEIDRKLAAAGWVVQDARAVNLAAARGVAVREFVLKPPHGRADYLLFVDRAAAGVGPPPRTSSSTSCSTCARCWRSTAVRRSSSPTTSSSRAARGRP